MKKSILFIALLTCIVFGASAQDSKGEFSVGADLYSNYVWRGTELSNNPVVQPSISYSCGGFSLGAWGSYNLSADKTGTEADLFAGYSFDDLGLSFTVTDYFFPGDLDGDEVKDEYFDYDANHTLELAVTKTFGDFYLLGSVYFMRPDHPVWDDDLYFEAGYSFENFSVFAGAGDNSYSSSEKGDFAFCNVGISTSKDIAITEKFSLPMSGSVIVNPDTEQIYLVVGVSF